MSERLGYIGVVGLGVMGRGLALNMADHGIRVIGFDTAGEQVEAFEAEGRSAGVRGVRRIEDLVAQLASPRVVLAMVPAGKIVDAVVESVVPLLAAGDVLIDAGNSHFTDTNCRGAALTGRGLSLLGVGVSGGAEGARRGPSIMPGGPRNAYDHVRPILEAIAAKVGGEPCVAWLGPGSAGHYVKMVHNGIEYAVMQLLAETYDLMRALGFDNDRLADVYRRWNDGPLAGYLVEITSRIFLRRDERTGGRLIDAILDEAAQKGTGAWTSQEAMALGAAVPAIDAAVTMRNLSGNRAERDAVAAALGGPAAAFSGDADALVASLERAMLAATIVAYAQGLSLLRRASDRYGYDLDLGTVARIWRGGCVIRAAVLEDVRAAYARDAGLVSLLADPAMAATVSERLDDLRAVVRTAAQLAVPAPALAACLAYVDGLRAGRLPMNLVQAQRDLFGAHTYRRTDTEGAFHTEW